MRFSSPAFDWHSSGLQIVLFRTIACRYQYFKNKILIPRPRPRTGSIIIILGSRKHVLTYYGLIWARMAFFKKKRSVLRSKKYGTVVRQYRVLSVRYLRIRAADPAVRPIGAVATQSQPSRQFLVRIQHIVARTDLDHFARRSRRYPSPPYCAFFIFFLYGPPFFFLSLSWETGPILIRSIDFPYKSALRLGWF